MEVQASVAFPIPAPDFLVVTAHLARKQRTQSGNGGHSISHFVGQKLIQDFQSGIHCPLNSEESVGPPGFAEKQDWARRTHKFTKMALSDTGCEGFHAVVNF